MSDLCFTIVDELGYFGLKRVCAYDSHRLTRSLQAVVAWLSQPRIEKIDTFVSFSYPRFPYQPKTINKWFSVSAVGDGQGGKVYMINVDRDGQMRKSYTTQFEHRNFPWSLEDLEDFEVFYHGTSHNSAVGIINKIDLAKGKLERDFSSGDGFYLGKRFQEALETNWAKNRPPNSAVLVYLVRRDELRNQESFSGMNLTEADNMEQWKEVVRLFRTEQDHRKSFRESRNDSRSLRTIKSTYNFVEGPMASRKRDFAHPEPIPGSYQFCVRSERCAELFDLSLHSIVFFDEVKSES